MDCGLLGAERSLAGRRERRGAGWICNKLVKIDKPDALAPGVKGTFYSFDSFKPSLDFIGKSTQSWSPFIPGSFTFVVSTSKRKSPDFLFGLLIRLGQSSPPPSGASFVDMLCGPAGPALISLHNF